MFNRGDSRESAEISDQRQRLHTLTRLLLVLVAVGVAGGCTEQEDLSEASTETVATSDWAPTAYQWDSLQLPLGTYANDPAPFFTAFKNEWEQIKKKEYETTKEFTTRMENERFDSRFSENSVYAFPLLDVELSYNADSQSFESSGMRYMCWWDTTIPNHTACPLGRTVDSSDRYPGQNGYGTAAEVERSSGREFYLALPRSNLNDKLFRSPVPFEYDLDLSCRTQIQEAQRIAGKNVKVLVVGKLTARELLSGVGRSEIPTVGNPIEEHFETQAIPFEVMGFVCYDSMSGAILDTVRI